MDLLFVAIILLLAIIAINFSRKTGLPALLIFLVLGLISNSFVEFNNYYIADKFSTLALIVIMFYGGFGTNWKMGKPVVKEAAILSTLGVVATALLTGSFAHFVLNLPKLESFLLGSIVGSTDYASVSNALSSQNLNLKFNTGSLLELESGSNDPAAYTMTMLFLALILGKGISVPLLVLQQIVLGAGLGILFAWVVGKLLQKINFAKDGLSIVFMCAAALFTYAVTSVLAGNGYLAVYLFGIIIGNKHFIGKRDIVFFFDGVTELMNIFLFFLLGLLATPEKILINLPIAGIIMLFMTIIARPLAVIVLTLPFKLQANKLAIVSWAGLRGAAAIAFAIMAVNSGADITVDIYHIVFGICLISSLVQGSLMTRVAKLLNMVDLSDRRLTNFNAHSDKGRISFLKTDIHAGSKLIGSQVKDLNMNFDYIVAKIERNGKTIIPRGNVRFMEGDTVVIGGQEYFDQYGQDLLEFTLNTNHPWAGKRLRDLALAEDKLILAIQRHEILVQAEGDTELKAGDRILMLIEEGAEIHYDKEPENRDKEYMKSRVQQTVDAKLEQEK